MDIFNTSIFSRLSPKPTHSNEPEKNQTVTGIPSDISKYIHNDIAFVESQIMKYNEVTGILSHNSLYSKMYKMVCEAHKREVDKLKLKYNCNTSTSNTAYHKDLIALYKRILSELEDFQQILHNNYNKGIYDQHVSSCKYTDTTRKLLETSMSGDTQVDDDQLRKIEEDAPDSLLDPISFQLFSDPVVAPSGITYEKSHLLDHFNRQGPFDPLTRQTLQTNQLYPNLAVKDSVANYIKQSTEV